MNKWHIEQKLILLETGRGTQILSSSSIKWNDSNYWGLHFVDAHNLTQSRDTSLYCTIKSSLAERLNMSKTFVLVVGSQTKALTKGGCQMCGSYNSWTRNCSRGRSVDYRSYIQYECEKAAKDGLRIVVIYNYASVDRDKCPEAVRYKGTHISGYYKGNDGKYYWEYQKIKDAIME